MTITFDNVHGDDTVYMDCLRAICGDTEGKSMMDAMCNLSPHTPKLGFDKRVYVDVLDRKLDHPEEQQFFVKENVFSFFFKRADELTNNPFDVIICSDGIEHLTKEAGFDLLKAFSFIGNKYIIFTPLGEHLVNDNENDPEGHHSGWFPTDLPNYASIVFPNYHPTLNIGAFFAWYNSDIKKDFERVLNELKQKSWARPFLL